jgi:phosphate starvation-inducible PhoH-like protein
MATRLTRKEKRQQKEQEKVVSLKLQTIQPLTENQTKAFRGFSQGKNLVLHGSPGTGKTFIGLYLALSELSYGEYTHIQIIRSTVPTRDMGFLPGSASEKTKVYETPYGDIVNELYDKNDAYDQLKHKGTIRFSTTAFIRGITLNDTIIIVDEAQNMSKMEIHSVLTRVGDNSRIILCGDVGQDDLTNPRFREESGLYECMKILKRMNEVQFVEFGINDICRSGFVKNYIIEKENHERAKNLQQAPKGEFSY